MGKAIRIQYRGNTLNSKVHQEWTEQAGTARERRMAGETGRRTRIFQAGGDSRTKRAQLAESGTNWREEKGIPAQGQPAKKQEEEQDEV